MVIMQRSYGRKIRYRVWEQGKRDVEEVVACRSWEELGGARLKFRLVVCIPLLLLAWTFNSSL